MTTTTSTKPVFDVGINEPLPSAQLLALGLQNIFGMAGMFVFPGLLGRAFNLPLDQIAYLYGMTFIVSGITTALQSALLVRLPIMQGPFAGSFAALMALGHIPGAGLGAAYGSLFVAALIWCLFSFPIGGMSLIGLFARFSRAPLISGMIVILTIIQISSVALPNWIGTPATPGFPLVNLGAGFIALVVFVVATIWGGRLRRGAVLIALVAGTLAFSLYRPISLEGVVNAPALVVPQLFPFGFAVRWDFVLAFLLTLAPASMAAMALYQIVGDWGKENVPPARSSQGIFAMGIGATLAGLIGGFSTIAYPDNVGLLRSTRVGSRYATLAAGALLIGLGGSVKFDMLLVVVPPPVLSAVATALFGIIMMHGIEMLSGVDWDDRKLIAAGMAALVGLGGLLLAPETLSAMPLLARIVLTQPIISGGIVLVIAYALLCRETARG
ncbi:MAG TPA: solute carrier family 23 protein [Micropepsaceae bacterium]|nr:solute carrier family 23 protein [Micropepsaceae bacterium]